MSTKPVLPLSRAPSVDEGLASLARGEWDEARASLEHGLATDDDPVALEGLGMAAWWLDLTAVVFDARERAFRLYRERGDAIAAARVAVWLGWDYAAFRGEGAVGRGWFGLARQLLAGRHDTVEYAWLSIREGVLALFEEGNPEGARRHAAEAIAAARGQGSRDFELLALAVDGLAQVSQGDVAGGMRQLDDVSAALIAGEITDRVAIGLAGCYLIAACERVRDYDRAAQWCARIKAFCATWGLRPLFAVCRTQYAAVCLWRGEWDEAERELVTAVEELSASRPAMTSEGAARLGELRRRQGRFDEAQQLFDEAVGHPLATVGRAALAFDRGDALAAGDLAERYLRGTSLHNRTERVGALELVVRARLATSRVQDARVAVEELESIARDAGTVSLRATARLCRGLLSAAAGELDASRRECEDAVDLFQGSGALYEGARARVELASVLAQMGRVDTAVQEVEGAVSQLRQMAAHLDLQRAERQLESMRQAPALPRKTDAAGLTRRELDVLRLIAKGLSNQRVAEQLFISEHTVHRHVANTLTKLGASSRSAAVAHAARLGLLDP